MKFMNTVFPRNLAAVRFNFKTLYHAVTIRGWLDFEGGVYRDQHAHTYTASVINLFICTYNACAHTLLSTLYHAARFQGQRDFEVQRDFEEIR